MIPCRSRYYCWRRVRASRRREAVELGQEHYDDDNDFGVGRVVDYGDAAAAPAATTPCDFPLSLSSLSLLFLMLTK